MSTAHSKHLTALQSVLNNFDELPHCTGTVLLNANSSVLFYQSGNSKAESLDFANATEFQLENLFKACEAATFGLDQRDVLDESYRKAGKMNVNRFGMNFSPFESGILDIVSDFLLRCHSGKTALKMELYKLNVYGPGGFFKAHVDTPRSNTMIGSLVVILPTDHEGGSLIIRHGGKEWTFDSAQAVRSKSTLCASFVAFFSDVEHEVMTVTSGYRVTLTYNLYGKDTDAVSSLQVATYDKLESDIKEALVSLLKDPAFLPDGGALGFGLAHKYPFNVESSNLEKERYLKGIDAAIKSACGSLSLDTALKAIYNEPDSHNHILLDGVVKIQHDEIEDIVGYLMEFSDAKIVYNFGEEPPQKDCFGGDFYNSYDPKRDTTPIVWVKPLKETNEFTDSYVSYGNEATMECVYGEVCLVAKVASAEERVG